MEDFEPYFERQEDEVEFLQCVFMNDFEDLRNKDPWKVLRDSHIHYKECTDCTCAR